MTQVLDFHSDTGEDRLPRIGMAPLVDIVLLLICFYLLVMRSIDSHTDVHLELPVVQGEVLADLAPAPLTINIPVDGAMTLNGAVVDLATLRGTLAAEHADAAASGTELRVVIRADGRGRYAELDDVLGACQDAEIVSITLRTREGERP